MYYIKINKNFVHQVGNQPRLCYDARSTNHQVSLQVNLLVKQYWGNLCQP